MVVALLVLATAITANFAGLYELPSLSFTRSGGRASAFSTGLLAAFVATPCTGPFMATAMGAALLLPWWEGLLLFAALGFGLALPFLLLGYVPALRRVLPKPGKWMDMFRTRAGGADGADRAGAAVAGVAAGWAMVCRVRRGLLAGGGRWSSMVPSAQRVEIVARGGGPLWLARSCSFAVCRAAEHLLATCPIAEESLLAAVPFSETALAEARAARTSRCSCGSPPTGA